MPCHGADRRYAGGVVSSDKRGDSKELKSSSENMQIKIAVCDDDIRIQFLVEGFLKHILEGRGIESEIQCFDLGDELCDTYEKGKLAVTETINEL